jgi:hypothetical protein
MFHSLWLLDSTTSSGRKRNESVVMARLSLPSSMAENFCIRGHETRTNQMCLLPRVLIQQIYKYCARNLDYNHSIRSFAEKKHLQFMKK